ncbi:MAG: homoserine dehydrogenase [Bordetella sp.]|nr:MAG: homoserine dehydrogenase [Bordetella sp.]
MKSIKVGLLGLGVVGTGTWRVLSRNIDEIYRRTNRYIEITDIAVRNVDKAYSRIGNKIPISNDAYKLVNDPKIDIIVELIGGNTLDLTLAAISNGKHIVTANKDLLAKHGNEIFLAASKHGVIVGFEAAVCGGVPIIKAMRESLTANRIQWLAGIVNGTTNFILSEMRSRTLPFLEVLCEAQRLGYAESDPTFDIEGIDSANKATLLSALAFGIPLQFEKVHIEGISNLAQEDILYAEKLGYRIKLLAITKRVYNGIEIRVHPALIPINHLLSNVEGAMNAVIVHGDIVGSTIYYGQGAGAQPTASSVVADLVDIVRLYSANPLHCIPHLGFQSNSLSDLKILPIEKISTSYYLRLSVEDLPGVLADVALVLASSSISINSMFQEPSINKCSDIIFLTHKSIEENINLAIKNIESLRFVRSKVTRLRMENLV